MVGPSVDEDDREAFMFKFRVGFALFVGVSMALVTAHGGADLPVAGAAAAGGTGVGAVLAWWVFPDRLGPSVDQGRRR